MRGSRLTGGAGDAPPGHHPAQWAGAVLSINGRAASSGTLGAMVLAAFILLLLTVLVATDSDANESGPPANPHDSP